MKPLRVLELGNFVVPAYAGMILAEQGASVEKWTNDRDPILGCRSGIALWEWINHGKTLVNRPVTSLLSDPPAVDVVSIRPPRATSKSEFPSECRTEEVPIRTSGHDFGLRLRNGHGAGTCRVHPPGSVEIDVGTIADRNEAVAVSHGGVSETTGRVPRGIVAVEVCLVLTRRPVELN
jgi:hypothetical protein